ncbi:hypothetical protein Q9Q94_08145 [Uliginosibacterium sp. 31-16]|uniref:hypothetical protein n=1 Tax=Uliginosibacterium sp. 31-16 TaxID=3068315 RepID=UPI00273F2685|nr:hypothetical protein [Uliginosibacterium sp. 31-16]MDP5239496.1 hypothetical protein [Uliginosibacterium sp. 31-16]
MKLLTFIRSSAIALAVFGFLAASPASFAKNPGTIHGAHVSVIKVGMSGAEVERLVGKPTAKPKWLDGTSTWTYETDDWTERCDVDFGADGKVKGTIIFKRANSGNT